MSGQRKVPGKYHPRTEAHQHNLKHMLDFGPDSKSEELPENLNESDRLKRLLKELEYLNQRVDKLSSQY